MSFNKIGNYLENKLVYLEKKEEEKKRVKNTVTNFLSKKKYPQANVIYQPDDKQIVIETQSKVFATELSCCLEELNKTLKENKILANRIIIR